MKFLLVVVALAQISHLQFAGAVDFVPVKAIPGTPLHTGLYYKVSMLPFPQGWVTYITKETDIFNIEIELDPAELPKYAEGQPFEIDNQWSIGESEQPGQFLLTNRRKSDGLLTYRSETVGSGYHAGILTHTLAKTNLAPGGVWRNDALWIIHPFGKYHKLENVGKKGYFLTWTYTKYNQHNYFIQLANYDAGDDAKFLFIPGQVKFAGRVSDFQYLQEPDNNNGNRTETYTFSYKNEGTTIESVISSFKIERGRTTTIPKDNEFEITNYNSGADNIVIPFKVKIIVTATAQRIIAARPSETQEGELPGDFIESHIKAQGDKNIKVVKQSENSVEIEVTGQITRSFALKITLDSTEAKKN